MEKNILYTQKQLLTAELEIACLNLPRLVKMQKIKGKDASKAIQEIIDKLKVIN